MNEHTGALGVDVHRNVSIHNSKGWKQKIFKSGGQRIWGNLVAGPSGALTPTVEDKSNFYDNVIIKHTNSNRKKINPHCKSGNQ